MESNNTALGAKNDAAAAKELRELREDTLEGLKYALSLIPVPSHNDCVLEDAIEILKDVWPE